MLIRKPRYAPEDAARRGDEIYDQNVRSKLEPRHNGEIVAIDLDSGAWEVGPDQDTAANRLESRLQDPQIMVMRVGSRYITRFGAERGKNIGVYGVLVGTSTVSLKKRVYGELCFGSESD